MKSYFISLLLLLSVFSIHAQNAKRIYVTLDVSGSMTGNKYALANYTTQMIVTLCDDDDDVYMILYGVAENLSKKSSPLSVIQKPMDNLKFGTPTLDSEFGDIIGFNRIYHASADKQDWLFIIGDGEWGTMSPYFKSDREKFGKIIKSGTVNICYLQTKHSLKDGDSDFTDFLSQFGVVDMAKSDINPQTIKDGCDHFARKILGFSETPLALTKSGSNCISIKTEMPLNGFYLVYQDAATPNKLPKIEEATADGQTLKATLKGTPTTQPLKTYLNEVDLSGRVYWVKGSNSIQANKEIQVCFDKAINLDNVRVYPVVEDVGFGSLICTTEGGKLKYLDSQSYAICKDESKARVRIELNGKSSKKIPEALLRKTKVVIKANNKDYPAKFNNGGFECDIDLFNEETQYYAECDCPGYFKRVTPISKIIKSDDCEPDEPSETEVTVMPTINLGTFTFDRLKSESIIFTIRDSLTNKVLKPSLFDISFDVENGLLYEDPVMHIKNDTLIVLEVRPRGEWCECFFPESLNIKMISTPKSGATEEYGKLYRKTVYPLHIDVVKGRTWLSRCLWVIIALIALLLFFIYLQTLMKKRRFKKNAMITPTYYDYYGNKRDAGSIYLRKDGFGAWFSRWFIPGDERSTLNFDKPTTSLRFVAADSYDMVNIPKDGNIDPSTMKISGYDPKRDQRPKEPVKLSNHGKINVKKSDGSDDGYLIFSSGDATDGAGYRIILSLLMVAAVIAFVFLAYLLIRSLF